MIKKVLKSTLFAGLLLVAFACKKPEWKVGDKVHVKSNAFWYAATILSVEKDGKYKIHYDGWASSWDEVVPTDRVRSTSDGTAMPVPEGMFEDVPKITLNTIMQDSLNAGSKGKTIAADQLPAFDENVVYKVGDKVWVEWAKKWYESSIVEALGRNKYKIHYEGWTKAFDEEVDNKRIRPQG